jgi:hypothetical protein
VLAPHAHLDKERTGSSEHGVRSRWGSEGRVNLMGTLGVEGEGHEQLEYRMLKGSCESGELMS